MIQRKEKPLNTGSPGHVYNETIKEPRLETNSAGWITMKCTLLDTDY